MDKMIFTVHLEERRAIPLLGIYPDKTLLKRDTCTRMFMEALLTKDKTQFYRSISK